jgi:hypothetical protein
MKYFLASLCLALLTSCGAKDEGAFNSLVTVNGSGNNDAALGWNATYILAATNLSFSFEYEIG